MVSANQNSQLKNSQAAFSERLESYFTSTGFLDLLPVAADIARQMGYGEPEVIEAVCMVFDKQRYYPPTGNRSAWFATVFKEKLCEAHATIARWRDRQEADSTISSQLSTTSKPVYHGKPQQPELARKETEAAKETLKTAADQATLQRDRAVLDARTEGIKTREELAMVREEKAALEIQIVRLKEEKAVNWVAAP